MIIIESKRHNFRRCGIAHPSDAVDYPDDRFTPEELKILQAEPMLIVEVVLKKQPDPPAPSVIPAEAGIQEREEADKTGKKPLKPPKKGNK